jgi:hypothetical protein
MSLRPFATFLLLLLSTTVRAALPIDVPERVLLPLLTPPVFGSRGSEFRTAFTVENMSDRLVYLFGINAECEGCFPEEIGGDVVGLEPQATFIPRYDGTPGRFLILEKGDFDRLAVNLRVYDVSRNDRNFGTELPIVRDRELTTAPIYLPAVPVTDAFRNTLRIYGTKAATVRVTIGTETTDVALRPGLDEFQPAYAIVTTFPTAPSVQASAVRVTVTPLDTTPDAARIWAFISVTNNDTQTITTITPQR